MQKILDNGADFTAVIASNDLSCLGAIQSLEEAGRLIPDDVAVIGFDDILDARSLSPSLTTIRNPTFSLGFQIGCDAARSYSRKYRSYIARGGSTEVDHPSILWMSATGTSLTFSSKNSLEPA